MLSSFLEYYVHVNCDEMHKLLLVRLGTLLYIPTTYQINIWPFSQLIECVLVKYVLVNLFLSGKQQNTLDK